MPSLILRRVPPILVTAVLALGFVAALRCQQAPAKRSTFEVASVKPEKDCAQGNSRFPPSMDPGAFRLPCVSVRGLIGMAYSVFSGTDPSFRKAQVIGGPSWIDSDTYSINAKPETASTATEMMGPMLRSLLEDRFRLRIHTEPRDTPVYLLTVAEPNPKLRATKDGDCVPMDLSQEMQKRPSRPDPEALRSAPKQCGEIRMGRDPNGEGMAFDLYGATMAVFVSRLLTPYARRPVVDNTGLKGRFDVHLAFDTRPPQGSALLNGQAMPQEDSSTESSSEFSIFTAVRKQLGLKLTPGKSPLDAIVIDSVERPSEN
jgi:uncharacterized protein (TIGR03435 family)